jgi:HK97 family phage portal protein
LAPVLDRRSTQWLTSPGAWNVLTNVATTAGVSITEEKSLTYSPVYAAVRVLTDMVSSLPLFVYRRLERGKERATEHPLYSVLHEQANPEMTSLVFREVLQGHLATWGNAYAEIQRGERGQVVALWPLLPDRTWPERRNGQRRIMTVVGGQQIALPADRVLHIMGFGFDGLQGYSPIRLARESLGLTAAAESFGAQWFGNGARVAGMLSHPGKLGPDGRKRLREGWEESHKGLSNAHRVAVLEEGMTWTQIGIPPDDSQFLETRKFQVDEVARWFKVPPHMIASLERATFSNIEQQGIDFVVHTARPWLVRWEQAILTQLFTDEERREYYAEFLIDALMRGDSAARASFYQSLFNIGTLSPNDILELENRNPVEGGDQRFVPLNMVPLDAAGLMLTSGPAPPEPDADEDTEPEPDATEPARHTVMWSLASAPSLEPRARPREQRSLLRRRRERQAIQPVMVDAARRVLSRETTQIKRKLSGVRKRAMQPADFRQWMDEFYATFAADVAREFLPIFLAYASMRLEGIAAELDRDVEMTPELRAFIEKYAQSMSQRWAATSAKQLRTVVDTTPAEDLDAAVEDQLTDWAATRPAQVARNEATQVGEAFTYAAYGAAGVTLLRWLTSGESCPLCQGLDGKVVGREEAFVQEGQTVASGADGVAPFVSATKVLNPPLHDGCDCIIVAG